LASDSTQTRVALEDIRRVELIAATLRTISDKGFERATVRDIAQAAGASVGSVSYYFKGKHELLLAAVAESDARFRTRVREAVEETQDCADKLQRVVELCFPDVHEEGVDWAVFVDFWQQASRHDSFRTIFEEANSEWVELLTAVLTQGASEGTLCFRGSAMDASLAFAALIDGLALHTRVTKHVDSATARRVLISHIDGLRAQRKPSRHRMA
jgi:AcrR family transcriptional regulator